MINWCFQEDSKIWLDAYKLLGKPDMMSGDLEAIAKELQRLKREGVDHVFVDNSTLESLPTGRARTQQEPQRQVVDANAIASLTNLVDKSSSKADPKIPQNKRGAEAPTLPEPPTVERTSGSKAEQLAALKAMVDNCSTCREQLSKHGKLVFGEGSDSANIFFCGEAPGADEEREGRPFVGKAGELLTKVILAMGLEREDVYLANVLKWRPEHDKPYGNRPPTAEEIRFCLPYLKAQLEIIQPEVIIALGNSATSALLGADPSRKMTEVRGSWASYNDIPTMITFHPSYLLRNGTLKTKRIFWEDMLKVMEKCSLDISDRQRGFFLPKN